MSADQGTHVVIIDDNEAFAEAIGLIVGLQPDLVFDGSAATLRDGLMAIEKSAPDVVLIDVHLPDADGIAGVAEIATRYPGIRVVVLSGESGAEIEKRAQEAGAAGYVVKTNKLDAILSAIRAR